MKISELASVCGHQNGALRVSPSTLRTYRYAATRLQWWLGRDGVVGELSASDMLAFHVHLRDSCPEISTTTGNTIRRTLRGMVRRVGLPELAQPLRQLRAAPSTNRAMRDEHVRLLMAHASVRDLAIIALLAMSGGRRGVVANLRKENLRIWEGENGDWRLAARAISKNEREVLLLGGHEAALAMSLWLSVQPCAASTSYVFTTDLGTPLRPQSVNSIFDRVARAAHLPAAARTNPHSLRHRFALDKLSTHDAAMVAAWLGHSSPRVTLEIYGRPDEERLTAAFFGDPLPR